MPSGLLKARCAPAAASASQASGITAATSSAIRVIRLGGEGTGSAVPPRRGAVARALEEGADEAAERVHHRCAGAMIPAARAKTPIAIAAVMVKAAPDTHAEGESPRAPALHQGMALTSSSAVGSALRQMATRVTRRRTTLRRSALVSRSTAAAQASSTAVDPMSRTPAGITVR